MTYVGHDAANHVYRWRCDAPPRLAPGQYAPPGSPRCCELLQVAERDLTGRVARPGAQLAEACARVMARQGPGGWQFVKVEIDRMDFAAQLLGGAIKWDTLMCPDHRMPFLNDDALAGDPIKAFGGSEKDADIPGAVTRAHHEDVIDRALSAGPPPRPLENRYGDAPIDVRAVVSRRWRADRPGVRTPVPDRGMVEVSAGDHCEGPEQLTPDEARKAAAALIAAAEWVEAQL